MADYIYTMESRLSPEQMRTVNTVQNIARTHGMNVYLTGGAIRDILTGFPIRDLDFTVQGDPLKLRQEIENAGGIVDMADPVFCVIHAVFQGIGAEIGMARSEVFDKPGKPPAVTPATINEDLRRRDFTCNAMALSLNEGSRGLLLDPFNGTADIEARLLRILHSYAFLEDPSRLIRATRFAARFGWELEERTRARYDSAREGEYIQFLGSRAIGYEIEQIAHEENPIAVMQALEEQGWLKVLCPKWTVAKANVPELAHLLKTRATMAELNIPVDAAPAVMHFLTVKLGEAEVAAIQKAIPHREFVAAWKRLESDAKDLSKKLLSKEAAVNSGAWKILSAAKPEALLYLDVTGRNKTVDEKIKNFFGKWRQVQEKFQLRRWLSCALRLSFRSIPGSARRRSCCCWTASCARRARSRNFSLPFEPPPPPPPPAPVRRGRAAAKKAAPQVAKAEAPQAIALAAEAAGAIAASAACREFQARREVSHRLQAQAAICGEKDAKAPEAMREARCCEKNCRRRPSPRLRPVKAPAKPSAKGKAVAKSAPKKAAKPAGKKAGKAGESPPGRHRETRRRQEACGESVRRRKQHGHKEHKPGKKHSKRR